MRGLPSARVTPGSDDQYSSLPPRDLPLVGVHQLGLEHETDEDDIQRRTRHMIARSLNIGRVVAFAGSGLSAAYARYPSWDSLVDEAETIADEMGAVRRPPHHPSELHRSDRLLLRLGECEEAVLRKRGTEGRTELREKLAGKFDLRRTERLSGDPIRLVMKRLRIRRFLTTNYDVEIERAFVRVMGCEREPLDLPPWEPRGAGTSGTRRPARRRRARRAPGHVAPLARSLMLNPLRPELLLQFAVGSPGYEMGVFHCHGTYSKPESMVLTERDYQRMYLHDDPIHRSYREALNLAFSGNALLFLGVSMSEPDLLRPLREFVAEREHDQRERPLFALLPHLGKDYPDWELRRFLYSRYGVKACFYPVRDDSDRTPALCRAIRALATDWRNWWSGWQLKPALRRPEFYRPRRGVMVHHYSAPRMLAGSHRKPLSAQADERKVIETLRGGGLHSASKAVAGVLQRAGLRLSRPSRASGSVIVLGRPGTGKGSLGFRLAMGQVAGMPWYEKAFFGTMHFTNEMLSTIEGAADFLLGDRKMDGSPFDRLAAGLASGRHLVVLGGIERLLVAASSHEARAAPSPGGNPYPLEIGRPAMQEVHRLFEVLAQARSQGLSDVVLTSSIRPVARELHDVPIVMLEGVTCADLVESWEHLGVDVKLVRQLHDALRGHHYALAVLEEALLKIPNRDDWLAEVLRRLTAVDLSRRGAIAMDVALSHHVNVRSRRERSQLLGVVHRLALFPTPVGVEELLASWSPAPDPGDRATSLSRILEGLEADGLALRVERDRHTAHTLLRQHFLHHLGRPIGEVSGALRRVGLTAFSAESAAPPVPPPRTASGRNLISANVDNLLEHIDRGVRHTGHASRALIRAAFGLIRATWSVSAISQQQHLAEPERADVSAEPAYHRYHRRLVRLTNAIRRTQANDDSVWFSREVDPRRVSASSGLLYADELAWLYNELGMLSYAQGSAHDAYALFRIGQDINEIAERQTKGPRWCQSELNLAGVHIESANLQRARYHLENALRGARDIRDDHVMARVSGYLGLLNHLSGNYSEAANLYDEAIEKLRAQGERRGLSIFLRHRGDLRRKQKRSGEAAADVRDSIVIAESGGHLDLVQYARVAEANLRRSRHDATANDVLLPALDFARQVGLPKLEADTLKVQAQLALEHGEVEVAVRLALRSLAIAVASGMQLRVTAGLVLMGRVARKRGDWGAARSILGSAIALGYEQGYQLQIEEADRELLQIPAGH